MSETSGNHTSQEEARKAELEAKIRKRVGCEERAFRIVEKLLENTVSADYLAECGQYITPSHYADIVEERAIVKFCGYPVCDKQLGNVLKQKYFISTKSNRVYDITERKNFCSNHCFQASKYFEKQISTTPVWLRETEAPVDLKILEADQNIGSPGFKVIGDVLRTDVKKDLKVLHKLDGTPDTTTTNTEQFSTTSLQKLDSSLVTTTTTNSKESSTASQEYLTADDKGPKSCESPGEGNSSSRSFNSDTESNESCSNIESVASSVSEKFKLGSPVKESKKSDKSETSSSVTSSKTDYLMQLLNKRKHLLSSMVDDQPLQSVEEKRSSATEPLSRKFEENLQIKENVVEVHSDFNSKSENAIYAQFTNTCSSKSQPTAGDNVSINADRPSVTMPNGRVLEVLQTNFPNMAPQLLVIFSQISEWVSVNTLKYLGMIENETGNPTEETIKPGTAANDIVSGEGTQNISADYEGLRKKSEEYISKVQDFYKGSAKFGSKTTDTALDKTVGDEGNAADPILPPVDSIAQMRIRKKIVLEKLEKSMSEMLVPLGLAIQHISSELRELVSTFGLTSTNITFKPGEWTFVSLIMIKMLSRKIPTIQQKFRKGRALHFYPRFLKTLGVTLDDLERVLVLILKPTSKAVESEDIAIVDKSL